MTQRPMYYKRDGTPYKGMPSDPQGTYAWGKDFENQELKRVAETTLFDGKWISTVWLGLDHQFGDGAPLIFETMVFEKEGGDELDMERYSTEAEAIAGHERMIKKWSNPSLLTKE